MYKNFVVLRVRRFIITHKAKEIHDFDRVIHGSIVEDMVANTFIKEKDIALMKIANTPLEVGYEKSGEQVALLMIFLTACIIINAVRNKPIEDLLNLNSVVPDSFKTKGKK